MERFRPEVLIGDGPEYLARHAAQLFADLAQIFAINENCFTVALSGGNTPRRFYELLATSPFRERIPWDQLIVFWGDERCVPPDSPESNYRMAEETLLSKVPIPRNNIYRIPAEMDDPEEAARGYESVLRQFFQDEPPGFDLAILGLGADGHTASLFPGNPVLNEDERLVAAPFVEQLGVRRITLTPPVFRATTTVLFLVAGSDKAEAVSQTLEGEYDPQRHPAQLIEPENRLLWLLDGAAASQLRDVHRHPAARR